MGASLCRHRTRDHTERQMYLRGSSQARQTGTNGGDLSILTGKSENAVSTERNSLPTGLYATTKRRETRLAFSWTDSADLQFAPRFGSREQIPDHLVEHEPGHTLAVYVRLAASGYDADATVHRGEVDVVFAGLVDVFSRTNVIPAETELGGGFGEEFELFEILVSSGSVCRRVEGLGNGFEFCNSG